MADTLDLDALDKEESGVAPYAFTLGGEQYTVQYAPDEIDWQVAFDLSVNDTPGILKAYLGEEQFEKFSAHTLKLRTLNKLVEAIDQHYSASLGEGSASQPS